MKRSIVLVLVSALVGPIGLSACEPAPTCAKPALPTTVAYRSIPGVPANSVSLDIHAAPGVCDAPVVMWVHGGGYQIGDKSQQVSDKIKLFNGRGWTLVSVNYRLTVTGDPTSAHYPDHFDDVAASAAWVHRNIARWNGNPDRIALLGHSAGADIVSNVTTNPAYLEGAGVPLSTIDCAGPLDTEGFDKAAASQASKPQWDEALGNDPNYVTETSATLLLKKGIGIPPTIGVYRGTVGRQNIEKAYLDKLTSAGIPTMRIDARSLTHNQVNTNIGAAGDKVMTKPIVDFLSLCFAT